MLASLDEAVQVFEAAVEAKELVVAVELEAAAAVDECDAVAAASVADAAVEFEVVLFVAVRSFLERPCDVASVVDAVVAPVVDALRCHKAVAVELLFVLDVDPGKGAVAAAFAAVGLLEKKAGSLEARPQDEDELHLGLYLTK